MNFRLISARALLLALAVCLSISPMAQTRGSVSEDRNFDGQADVWEFYDEAGHLVRVLRDRNYDGYVDAREVLDSNRVISRAVDENFDHQFDLSFTGTAVTANSDLMFNVAPQPFLLPRAVFMGDRPLVNRAPFTREPSSESRSAARPSGRAPPAAL